MVPEASRSKKGQQDESRVQPSHHISEKCIGVEDTLETLEFMHLSDHHLPTCDLVSIPHRP